MVQPPARPQGTLWTQRFASTVVEDTPRMVLPALMIKLVAWMVKGFTVSSFWTALFASIFISLLSFIFSAVLWDGMPPLQAPAGGNWL